jgi:hypothetical protein
MRPLRLGPGKIAATAALVLGLLVSLGAPAGAHDITGFNLSCSTVSATVTTDNLSNPPYTWNVQLGNGSFQKVPTTETVQPSSPGVDVRVVTGDISALTAGLHGQSANVTAFVSWAALPNGDQNFTGTITCGTTPTTVPTQVSPGVVSAPTSATTAVAGAVATAPTAVAVTPRLTG